MELYILFLINRREPRHVVMQKTPSYTESVTECLERNYEQLCSKINLESENPVFMYCQDLRREIENVKVVIERLEVATTEEII